MNNKSPKTLHTKTNGTGISHHTRKSSTHLQNFITSDSLYAKQLHCRSRMKFLQTTNSTNTPDKLAIIRTAILFVTAVTKIPHIL